MSNLQKAFETILDTWIFLDALTHHIVDEVERNNAREKIKAQMDAIKKLMEESNE